VLAAAGQGHEKTLQLKGLKVSHRKAFYHLGDLGLPVFFLGQLPHPIGHHKVHFNPGIFGTNYRTGVKDQRRIALRVQAAQPRPLVLNL
jgi:hypothetical protein